MNSKPDEFALEILEKLVTEIEEADAERPPDMIVTPLTYSHRLSEAAGCRILLKCEHLQETGSFKYRGAANKLRKLRNIGLNAGVITASTGNHGRAVALAGKNMGIPVTVWANVNASASKLDTIRELGAELRLMHGSAVDIEVMARNSAVDLNRVYISPYNDYDVVAGQGTLGLEILRQTPDLDAVFVSVGGGGLASGIGVAIKARRPDIELVGCWPERAASLMHSLHAGRIIVTDERETISDGTAGGVEQGSITFPLCQHLISRCVTASEMQIALAMRNLAEIEHWIVEGAAGVALAGAKSIASDFSGKTIVVVLCGRNIALEVFLGAVCGLDPGVAAPVRER